MMSLELLASFAIQRLINYFHNVRVFDWKAYFGIAFLGFVKGVEVSFFEWLAYKMLQFAITIVFYLAFTFSINNCFDIKCDTCQVRKLRKNPIAAGRITFAEGLILSLCMASIGLALSYLWFGGCCFLIYSALVLLGGAYSAPPPRLKSIPLVDLFSHSLFFGALLYLYGFLSAGGGINLQAASLATSISIYSIILELRNHLEDYKADFNSGAKTAVCWMGYDKSMVLLKTLIVIHILFLTVISHLAGLSYLSLILALMTFVALKLQCLKFEHLLRLMDLYTCVMYALISLPQISLLLNLR